MISHSKKILFIHPPKVGGNSIHSVLKDYYDVEAFATDNRIGVGQGMGIRRTSKDGNPEAINKHGPISYLYEVFPEARNYHKFSVIRNPWDRMVSWFAWHYALAAPPEFISDRSFKARFLDPDHLNNIRTFHNVKSPLPETPEDTREDAPSVGSTALFRKFIRAYERQRGWFSSFSSMFKEDGVSQIDSLIKFENYEEDLRSFCKRFSIEISSIPQLNVSGNRKTDKYHYSDWYVHGGRYDDFLIEWVRDRFKEDFEYHNYEFGK